MNAVDVVSASAGTGKTHHLTEVLAEALLTPAHAVRPEGVVALTYTRRAAAELQSRLRRRLMAAGAWEAASRIRDGYLGTVHSVCDRLLREFCFEAGLSPDLQPMTETAKQRLLDEAVGDVLTDAERQSEMQDVLRRLRLEERWRDELREILSKARVNAMGPTELLASAERSVETLQAMFPEAATPDPDYADELREALEVALEGVKEAGRGREVRALASSIQELLRDLRDGSLPAWAAQEKVARDLGQRKAWSAFGLPVAEIVGRQIRHPQLREDLAKAIRWVFSLAARALEAYAERKRAARVLDYDDLLAETLHLLADPGVAEELRGRLDLVLVDEFQDTSPMQLAILLRLASLSRSTTWVGDPKQAIYGFQGTDPELMLTAMRAALDGRPPVVLSESHRSRPPLVDLTNEVFTRAFARWGFPREQVEVTSRRPDPPELAEMPILDLWRWESGGRSATWPEAHAIAEGVQQLLTKQIRVSERYEPGSAGSIRPVRAGDVAVLLRTNWACKAVAEALRARGVPARVKLQQLLSTEEARLARSALGVVADPRAGVPAMEVSWLSGGAGGDPDEWLSRRFGEDQPFADDARVAALRALAARATGLSPSQAYEAAVEAVGLVDLCVGWPDGARRVANLEALRAEVRAYEDLCAVERSAATIPGLLAHLDAIDGAERDARDEQAMPSDPDAVTVLTFHQSKGLEWPVVVLGSLGPGRTTSPFERQVEPAEAFDPARPLAGRWIRWWPDAWPIRTRGGWLPGTHSPLHARALATAEARSVAAREEHERLRLLYVGFTRARDRLCLSVGTLRGERHDHWLRELVSIGPDGERRPILRLPVDAPFGTFDALVGDGPDAAGFPCRVRRLSSDRAHDEAPIRLQAFGIAAAPPRPEAPPEIVHPSGVHLAEPATPGAVHRLGPAVKLEGRVEMDRLGDAIHGFLASDVPGEGEAERLARARAFLAAGEVGHALPAPALLRIGDALRAWVDRTLGPGQWLREWPVRWLVGGRLLVGEIDLAVDLGDRLVVFDHKSFPGTADEREKRVVEHAGQLAAYAAALESALGKPVSGLYVHFPLRGEIQEVHVAAGAFERWLATAQADQQPAVALADDEWSPPAVPDVAPDEAGAVVVTPIAPPPLPIEALEAPEPPAPMLEPPPAPRRPDAAPERLPEPVRGRGRRRPPEPAPGQLSLFGLGDGTGP